MNALWAAAEIIGAVLAVCFAASVAFFAWCVLAAAADRRIARRRAADADEMALVNATKELKVPTDAEIVRAIDDWKRRFGNG